jgi:hypothetical protein
MIEIEIPNSDVVKDITGDKNCINTAIACQYRNTFQGFKARGSERRTNVRRKLAETLAYLEVSGVDEAKTHDLTLPVLLVGLTRNSMNSDYSHAASLRMSTNDL